MEKLLIGIGVLLCLNIVVCLTLCIRLYHSSKKRRQSKDDYLKYII